MMEHLLTAIFILELVFMTVALILSISASGRIKKGTISHKGALGMQLTAIGLFAAAVILGLLVR